MRPVAKLLIIWEFLMDTINNWKLENGEKIDPHCIIWSLCNIGLYNCCVSTCTCAEKLEHSPFCDIVSAYMLMWSVISWTFWWWLSVLGDTVYTNSKASDNQRESYSLLWFAPNSHTHTYTPAELHINKSKHTVKKYMRMSSHTSSPIQQYLTFELHTHTQTHRQTVTFIHRQKKKWAVQVIVPIHIHTLIPW